MSELPLSGKDMAKLMALAGSPAGKQLLAHLRATQGPALQSAMDQAAAGNYEAAKQLARGMLSSPEVRALLRQLGRDAGGGT